MPRCQARHHSLPLAIYANPDFSGFFDCSRDLGNPLAAYRVSRAEKIPLPGKRTSCNVVGGSAGYSRSPRDVMLGAMNTNLLLVLLVLLLLFGGGGFYWGGPAYGGGGLGLVLLVCLIIFLMGGFRSRP